MPESKPPSPSPEHRRVAAGQYERARQVIATGNFDYGIQLLLTCCKLDPANLIFRQTLRATEKTKYKNNQRGSRLALPRTWSYRAKIKTAQRSGEYWKVLEYGERILALNPWDLGVQMEMARAADALELLDVAQWLLEHARQQSPDHVKVNRALARMYEKRGNFAPAIALWEIVRKADPTDVEARTKGKDLAASDTIARGGYEEAVAEGGQKEGPAPLAKRPGTKTSPAQVAGADRLAQEAASIRARITADPTNANDYLQLAGIFRRADKLAQAREVLKEGVAPTGNHFDLTAEIAEIDIEPFRRNLQITEERLRTAPDDQLRGLRVHLLKEINSRELELFRAKSDRFPSNKALRFELGLRLLRGGQIDEAIHELQTVRSDARYQWRALYYLGFCFKSRRNWRLAARNFEESLHHLPESEDSSRKEILFQLAQGNADAGDLSRAVEFGLELANLDFGYQEIGRRLDEWQAQLQRARPPES